MFGLSITMRCLVNLTLLPYFKIKKHSQIRGKSMKVTTKCFLDYANSQNIEISWFEKMFGLSIKMTLAALVQCKTRICSAD